MRNSIMLLITGPILFGCPGSRGTNTENLDSGATYSMSGNNAPTISGIPSPETKYGETYVFEPTAVDADNDILIFNIQNKPAWLSFNSGTGKIFGQPTHGDIGIYENITISVSDGKSSSTLPAFSITVSQSAFGSVTLNWVPPTQNSDGSPLTDLAGYKIYYRKNSDNYRQEIRINNPGITTYVVENLSPATYRFSATAFNLSGVESAFSAETVRTID